MTSSISHDLPPGRHRRGEDMAALPFPVPSAAPLPQLNAWHTRAVAGTLRVQVDVAAVEALIAERTMLRRQRDFDGADGVRDRLTAEHGVTVYDKQSDLP